MRALICISLALGAAVWSEHASAQEADCDASSTNDWLTPRPFTLSPESGEPIAEKWLREIDPKSLTDAITMLATRPFVALDSTQAGHFLGKGRMPNSDGNHRPYLVRAVYPIGNPKFDLAWKGTTLRVSAYGMGCAPFRSHPILVYLDRVPTDIHVNASADL